MSDDGSLPAPCYCTQCGAEVPQGWATCTECANKQAS